MQEWHDIDLSDYLNEAVYDHIDIALIIRVLSYQIEIDLGQENRYHSVFACPILRQQSTESNPPMRLLCGHVISRDALTKLISGNK